VFGDNGGNRFQVLSEDAAGAATGDKDDMADEPSPAVERALGFGNIQGSMGTPAVQPVTVPPPEPAARPFAPSSQATSAAQPSLVFGADQSIPTPAEPSKPGPHAQHSPQPAQPAQSAPTRFVRSVIKSAIDEMATWMADRVTIGQTPETEPPLEV